jgi:cyanophycinase
MTPGPLALVGGDELKPGNEPQDRVLAEVAGGGPAFVLATAAARHRPDLAVENARRWFGSLGLDVEELPATRRSHVTSAELAARARGGRFFYLVGGDPGIVPSLLAGSPVWAAIVDAWRDGAALAGSSAGAMALGEWTLVRHRMPGDERRRYAPAFGLVPRVAVLPHFETFGHRWVGSALAAAPRADVVLVGPDERTAAVWRDGTWTALGDGSVTVIEASGERRTFAAGASIDGVPTPVAPARRGGSSPVEEAARPRPRRPPDGTMGPTEEGASP